MAVSDVAIQPVLDITDRLLEELTRPQRIAAQLAADMTMGYDAALLAFPQPPLPPLPPLPQSVIGTTWMQEEFFTWHQRIAEQLAADLTTLCSAAAARLTPPMPPSNLVL